MDNYLLLKIPTFRNSIATPNFLLYGKVGEEPYGQKYHCSQ
jgi:hypothetical protein